MRMKTYRIRRPKVVVMGGGTGLPVILKSLRNQGVDITAVVTVADDGGSSGQLRDSVTSVTPPGDLRNVLVALSDMPKLYSDIFQYRFKKEDKFLANHALGNLIIAGMSEMRGSTYEAIQLLSKMMHVKGNIYPSSDEPLVLQANFTDGTSVIGESKIALDRKTIDNVSVRNQANDGKPKAAKKVVSSILEADMIVLGPGSLFTSILPNLMISEIGQAMLQTEAETVYICNIMTQKGETERFTDADHVRVLNEHLGKAFIDTVLVNTEKVPDGYMNVEVYDEYLLQVQHDFKGLRSLGCRVVSTDFLELRNGGVFHDGNKVVEELLRIVYEAKN
ncbi:YvcK family protein [Tetragenococcus halophilus]|uniref:Putative gluconeogenesis factor n=1 Tax=Tetragenococcus halophilus (strain DSM 20338 / JCM 20259 / NCIMB 9735 / NBRC 12172) TaxID=945021 RepID=A0AAN1SHL0_TETHN|nr:YvcK family protein [Tetragenococcus halophilus]NRR75265.1 YvcK family protein [Tetragenococcus halophilus]NWN99544.1 YvcK family protein [Tetragenococcus halophilus]QXN85940.1 YvcK family protein [Tetragenococcus halophilus]RQD32691.1 YvcK family protein [Tetragenococcus halophilus subsp. halophilus DSM 20339]WJS81010.1 YvcK family protein [Tetragenococcus halophilus]